MKKYRMTFSNEITSYSHVTTVLDDYSHLPDPGEYIGQLSLNEHDKVKACLLGFYSDQYCPPIFKFHPVTRLLVEDVTPVDYVSPPLEECLL